MFRSIYKITSVSPKLRNFVLKLYSSTAERSTTLGLPRIAGLPKAIKSKRDTNVRQASEVHKGAKSNGLKIKGTESSGGKRGGSCKKVGTKANKGKMSNKPKAPLPPSKPGPPSSGYIEDKCDMFQTHKPNVKKWRTLSYAMIPMALALSAFVFATKEEHPKPEYIPYEYRYIRSKRFPWRDGRTSLFHGPNNLIPDDEETRIAKENETQEPSLTFEESNEEESHVEESGVENGEENDE